jgi:hypothetical protein
MSDEQAAPRSYDFDELYPGRFLKGGDFARSPRTLTIARVQLEELEGEKGKRKRGIVRFQEEPRELVLNKTNGLLLRAMFGRSTEAWVGRRVTFAFDADVKLGGKVVGGIRIVGSPEITAAREVEIALPRKRPFTITIQPTGQRAAQRESAEPGRYAALEAATKRAGTPKRKLTELSMQLFGRGVAALDDDQIAQLVTEVEAVVANAGREPGSEARAEARHG